LLVGEVGLPRREFLYEIKVWEANRIIRGYRKRNITELELLRLTAYSAFFSFRKNEQHLTPHSWLPLSFDKENVEDEEESDIPSMEEVERMREEIRRINQANGY
jgi:hypothetical protein